MNNILDKSLDSQFDKIENLTWFPWVGKGYKCAKRKLLVVGESHYLNEDSDENNEKRRELLIRDKEHTRNCLYEVLINKSWSSKTYSNIMEACVTGVFYQITKQHYRKSHTIISSKGKWIIQKILKNVPILMTIKLLGNVFCTLLTYYNLQTAFLLELSQ